MYLIATGITLLVNTSVKHKLTIDFWLCLHALLRPRACNAATHAHQEDWLLACVYVGAARSRKQPSDSGTRTKLIGCWLLAPPSLAEDWSDKDSSSRWLGAICRNGCVARLLLPSRTSPKIKFKSAKSEDVLPVVTFLLDCFELEMISVLPPWMK